MLAAPQILERRLPLALAILRISLGGFLLLWSVEKLVIPETTVSIWESFYRMEIGNTIPYAIGTIEAAFSLALILGRWRTWVYGLAVLLHGISTLSTWKQLIDPWGLIFDTRPNHLFLAGVPVLAAFLALYLLRDWDSWSLDGRRAAIKR